MSLIVYSRSDSYNSHLQQVLDAEVKLRIKLTPPVAAKGNIYLLHVTSMNGDLAAWVVEAVRQGAVVGIASDQPNVEEMLKFTENGALAYFNAYMADLHYEQLVRLLESGQSWYPPELLMETFSLARSAVRPSVDTSPLEKLTSREKEIAFAVSEGKTNKVIATDYEISERTVKSHLTNIFKKLEIKDRVALVIFMNQHSI